MENVSTIIELAIASITIASSVIGSIWVVFSKFAKLSKCEIGLSEQEKEISEIKKDILGHNDRLTRIETVLVVKHKGIDSIFSSRHSPRSLNSLGEQIFAEMSGRQFLEDNKKALFAQIDLRRPKAALDVETDASIALAVTVNEDFFIPIKSYVYNKEMIETEGGQKIDMTIETACYILSLPLRDMYLEDHPEIPR